ncbi:MAG: sulfurtransferase [Calditrichaeota bacterium]|nr:MAG: sulfurtransferase [Calditrichota bacterium]
MAPFYKYGFFSEQTGLIVALILGISFGFWLERSGFGYSRKLALQFYFKDNTVLYVMFTAILVAMLGVLFFSLFGWLDITKIYINPTYIWAQLIGGLILGVGFAIGGYCPGTSVVGAVTGHIDALFFLGGAMTGMFVFGEMFPSIEDLYNWGYMGNVRLSDVLNVSSGVVAFAAVVLAIVMFKGAEWAQNRFGKEVL